MIVIFIAVLLVMAVMNAALFYVLYQAADVTEKQVRACFVSELESYNRYIEARKAETDKLSLERQEIKKEISSLNGVLVSLKTSPFYFPRPLNRELYVPTARYVDSGFFDSHKLVKDMMSQINFTGVLNDIRKKYVYTGDLDEYNMACSLLDKLSMDVMYELCTVAPELQLETLKAALEGGELKLLESYLAELDERQGSFDVLGFRLYLRELKQKQDPDIYIRTGDKDFDNMGDSTVVHQYDSNISEGLRVVWQNQYFDYSIYRTRSRK